MSYSKPLILTQHPREKIEFSAELTMNPIIIDEKSAKNRTRYDSKQTSYEGLRK